MDTERIIDVVRSLDGSLVLAPDAGSAFPEIAWGDSFFYYAPDGHVPATVQPYGTIITKDYPDDTSTRLGRDGRWRVNVHVGRARFSELIGENPTDAGEHDFAATDLFLPHPVYRSLGWVSVVNPAERTTTSVLDLLRHAHEDARARVLRRARG